MSPAAISGIVSQIKCLVLPQVSKVNDSLPASPDCVDTSACSLTDVASKLHRANNGPEWPYVLGLDVITDDDKNSYTTLRYLIWLGGSNLQPGPNVSTIVPSLAYS